jgi:hypothetical protein
MNQYYLGNTLINDAYLGSIRVEDLVAQEQGILIEYVVAAAGGSGGGTNNNRAGGGGGAGGLTSGSLLIISGSSFAINVGIGGLDTSVSGSNGGNSVLSGSGINIVSIGGGRAGYGNSTPINGSNGGSGGGGGQTEGGTSTAGTGSAGQGFAGVGGTTLGSGGGGGSKSAAVGSLAGSGSTWLDGNVYSQGGAAGTGNNSPVFTIYGAGGAGRGAFFTQQNALSGGYGAVKIRYAGTGSKATGGIISFSGGYTYHLFDWPLLQPNGGTGSFTY